MIKKYSQLHTAKREILEVSLPGKYSFPRKVTVFKNPLPADYRELAKQFREEYPLAPKGTPATRSTYDEKGNYYLWPSEIMHYVMEHALYKQHGIKTDQNADKYPIEKEKFAE